MDRRAFVATAAACIAGVSLPAKEQPLDLADIHKLAGAEWVKVRMSELKDGDIFCHSEFKSKFKACGEPEIKNGKWGINCFWVGKDWRV